MKNIPNGYHKFRFWCQKVLPLVYDDSLSYYEVIAKLVKFVNDLAERISDAFEEINTNVKEYVDQWLNDHPEATTTVQDGVISYAKLNDDLKYAYARTENVQYYFPNLTEGDYSGNSCLVKTPTKTIIFDCGPDNLTSSDWTEIRDCYDKLYTEGVFTNIDYIVISHYHYDHIEGLQKILDRYPHVGCMVYLPMSPVGYTSMDWITPVVTNYNNVISVLENLNVDYTIVNEETTVVLDPEYVKMTLFNSTPEDYEYYHGLNSVYNNYSMVALLQSGEVYSMYPGDIQRDAQIRIYNTRELPRLFLYVVHHHGIQNDDYIPYLEMIEPEYAVIMTSHNRALVSAASSMSGNYFGDHVGSTGYSGYAFASDNGGGSIFDGTEVPKIGWYYSYIDLYVDNEYTGAVYDGTEGRPFTSVNEALQFVRQEGNLHYRIRVKGTSTIYPYTWVRDFYIPIEIIGYDAGNGYPIFNGIYVRCCKSVDIRYCNFTGIGRTIQDRSVLAYVWSSYVSFDHCTMDGESLTYAVTAILIHDGEVYCTSHTFQNVKYGAEAYRFGSITVNTVTITNVTSAYMVLNLSVFVRGVQTTDGSEIMHGSTANGRPITIAKTPATAAFLAACTASVSSVPFYFSSAHPICAIANKKIYDLLTGEEVTP